MRGARSLIAVLGLTAWMVTCDRLFHVDTRTVVHFWQPQVHGQTVWVALTFGLGALGLVLVAPHFPDPTRVARPVRLAGEIALMTVIYGLSGWLGKEHATALAGGFAALALLRLAIERHRGSIVTLMLLMTVAGPAAESAAAAVGMFAYARPDILGVPWWLLALYANGAWGARELGALLIRRDAPAYGALSA